MFVAHHQVGQMKMWKRDSLIRTDD